jgi:hypothetical protein
MATTLNLFQNKPIPQGQGPTIPGSSTGIGSTFTPEQAKQYDKTAPKGYASYYSPSQGGSYTSGGNINAPKPIQNYQGGSYDPNTGIFTDARGNKQSVADPKAFSDKIVAQQEVERKKAFSMTGGLVAPGQVSSYFKTSTGDIQTDSQAIRTATNAAEQITKSNVVKPGQIGALTESKNKDFVSFMFGSQQGNQTVTYKTKSGGTSEIIIPGERITSVGSKQAFEEALAEIKSKGGKATGEIGSIQRFSPAVEYGVETVATYPFFMGAGFVAGKVIGAVGKGAATVAGPAIKAAEPVTVATSKAIGNVADDVFRMLSPATQQTVTRIAQKEVVQKGIQTGGLLIKTEATGEAFRQAGTAAPDIVSGTYLFATPGRVFTPTAETKKAAEKTYTAARVSYYGGERQTVDEQGVVVKTEKVPGKSSMGESFAEGYLPGIKVATPFAQEFEVQTKEKVQDIPEYKALKTDAEKRQYEKEFKDFYLNVQQIGGTVGQVLIETGGEVSGGGRLAAISGGGIKTRAGAIGRFALASGTAGIQEGVSTSELQAKVEQRTLSEQDRLNSAWLGGAFAGGFGALQAGTMGTKWNRGVNISGQLLDYPGEPLGDVLGGQVKKVLKVPDIKVGGQLVKTSFGPSITSQTDVKRGKTKQPQKQDVMNFFFGDTSLTQQERNRKAFGLPIKTSTQSKSNIVLPGTNVPVGDKDIVGTDKPGIPPVDSKLPDKTDGETTDEQKDEQKDETEQKQDVATNVPSFANVPSTVPVIAPQGFFFPGFFPVGSGGKQDARERTKIYDEMAAAGKRFEQLSGLPFTQRQSVKRRKTVMINGKEFRIGKRVKKE